jgi:hypothetical protein
MNSLTENYPTNSKFTLYDSSNAPLTVHSLNLALTKKDDEIIECRLTFQINLELYQRIDSNFLFNLNPVVRISPIGGDFQSEPNIQIEASLKPDLLPHLIEYATTADEAAAYLFQQNYPNPLLATENWLALSVKQSQKSSEVGYHTFWTHFSLLGLSMASSSQDEISESITNFFQDLVSLGLDASTKEITPASIGEVAKFFRDLAETTSQTKPPTHPIRKPEEKPNAINRYTASTQPIFAAMVNFFKEDNWHYVQLQGQSVLRLAFEGKNGKYDCYAQAIEEQQQFIFYSIGSIKIPKSKRRGIGEFLSRANYGMIIGNFELNFDNGEIRYKTSTNVKNHSLDADTIRPLVYTNVKMIDKYLPGIIAVAKSGMSPAEAIAQIETQIN